MVYVCKICGESFLNIKTFYNHKEVHSEKPYSCDLCEKSFPSEPFLLLHKRVHLGEKLYECDDCEYTFTTLGDLFRHIKKLHKKCLSEDLINIQKEENGKFFLCDLCDKSFTRKLMLINHERTHKREKRNECDICGKFFITQVDLSRHKMRLHREHFEKNVINSKKAYVTLYKNECNICRKSFLHKEQLIKHIAIVHKLYDKDNFIVKFDTLIGEIKEGPIDDKDCDPLSLDYSNVANGINSNEPYSDQSTSVFTMKNAVSTSADNARVTLPTVNSNKTLLDNLDKHNDEVDILKFKPIDRKTSGTSIVPIIDETDNFNLSKSNGFKGIFSAIGTSKEHKAVIKPKREDKKDKSETTNSTSHINAKDTNARNIEALRELVDDYKKALPIPKARNLVNINAQRDLKDDHYINMTEEKCTIDDIDLRDRVEDFNKDIPEDTFAMDDLADDYKNAIQVLVDGKQNKDSIVKNITEKKKTLFSCFVCDKLFVEKSDLLSHIASHKDKSSSSINDNSDSDSSSADDEDSFSDSDNNSSIMEEVLSDNEVIIEDGNTSPESIDDSDISIKYEPIE